MATIPWLDLFTTHGLSTCMTQAILQLQNFPDTVRKFCATCKAFNDNQRYWHNYVLHDARYPSLAYQRQLQILPQRIDSALLVKYRGAYDKIYECSFKANEGLKIMYNRQLDNRILIYDNGMVSRRMENPGLDVWRLCAMSMSVKDVVKPTDCVNVLAAVPKETNKVSIFWPSQDNSRHDVYEIFKSERASIRAIQLVDFRPNAIYLAVRYLFTLQSRVRIYSLTRRNALRVFGARSREQVQNEEFYSNLNAFATTDSVAVQLQNDIILYNPDRSQHRTVALRENTKLIKHTEAHFVATLMSRHDTTRDQEIITIQMLDTNTGVSGTERSLQDVLSIYYFDFTSMEYIKFDNSPFSGQLIVMCGNSCVTCIVRGLDLCPLSKHVMTIERTEIEALFGTVWLDPRDGTYRHRFYLIEENDTLTEWSLHP